MNKENEIVLFETKDKEIKLNVPIENETVWLSQAQMVELFGRDQSVISRHINSSFDEEVEKESNMHFLHIANSDKPVAFYSLDVIISVGYRVKSPRGIEFLNRNNALFREGQKVISDGALVAITLMIAESDPKEKDIMTTMVMNLLSAG